jgi:hypothetical protein
MLDAVQFWNIVAIITKIQEERQDMAFFLDL